MPCDNHDFRSEAPTMTLEEAVTALKSSKPFTAVAVWHDGEEEVPGGQTKYYTNWNTSTNITDLGAQERVKDAMENIKHSNVPKCLGHQLTHYERKVKGFSKSRTANSDWGIVTHQDMNTLKEMEWRAS